MKKVLYNMMLQLHYQTVKKDKSTKVSMASTSDRAPSSEINDKLIEYFNEALSAENAAVDRLDSRVQECPIPEGKQQLQHHLNETRQHQERLRQIISRAGGTPTDAKADLPTIGLPTTMMAKKTLTDVAKSITGGDDTNPMREEMELKRTKEDYGIENVEILTYHILIQLCQKLGVQNAVPLLQQSLREEQSMADWIAKNAPMTLDALWPRIEAALLGHDKNEATARGTTRTSATH